MLTTEIVQVKFIIFDNLINFISWGRVRDSYHKTEIFNIGQI